MAESDFIIVSLSALATEIGEENTSSLLSTFSSFAESDTESFLKTKALEMEKRDLCRTYLAISKGMDVIYGYVTVSIKCLKIPENNNLSSRTLRMMNIDGVTGVAQSYLIGQLSRSADSPEGFGKILIDIAFKQLSVSKQAVGCRLVRLDCLDKLVPYYEQYGFKLISNSSSGSLNQMLTVIRMGKHP